MLPGTLDPAMKRLLHMPDTPASGKQGPQGDRDGSITPLGVNVVQARPAGLPSHPSVLRVEVEFVCRFPFPALLGMLHL